METFQRSDTVRGRLAVQVADQAEVKPALYLTQQGSRTSTVHHPFDRGPVLELDLPPGMYLGQVTAEGYFPHSFGVTIAANKTSRESVELKKGRYPVASFEERLRAYGLAMQDAVDKIELNPNEHRFAKPGREGTNVARLQSLKQVRQYIGSPAGSFGHEVPRFEPVAVPDGLRERLLRRKLTDEDRPALSAMVDEHLNGNDRAYSAFIDAASEIISKFVNSSIIYTVAHNLTIAAGATYTFSGSLILDTLRISKTGRLNPTGVFKVDVTNWIEF